MSFLDIHSDPFISNRPTPKRNQTYQPKIQENNLSEEPDRIFKKQKTVFLDVQENVYVPENFGDIWTDKQMTISSKLKQFLKNVSLFKIENGIFHKN